LASEAKGRWFDPSQPRHFFCSPHPEALCLSPGRLRHPPLFLPAVHIFPAVFPGMPCIPVDVFSFSFSFYSRFHYRAIHIIALLHYL
jgi:hypothetical protein